MGQGCFVVWWWGWVGVLEDKWSGWRNVGVVCEVVSY